MYKSTELSLIVPTKDRPEKLANLLASLAGQTEPPGRVIVVDGGEGAQSVVAGFAQSLPVECHACRPPGQIRQRNLALSRLDERTPLVGFIDDDVVLEQDALARMIRFWNRVEPETAGVCFNIVNHPAWRHSPLLALFFMSSPVQGRVLRSGRNIDICNVPSDIRTQWLFGGATVWRRDVLLAHPQDNLDTRWAVGEDLRLSYPIGKKFPLYVCHDARARHEHPPAREPPDQVLRYRGRKETYALFHFVRSHRELSVAACLWMLVGGAAIFLVNALVKGNKGLLQTSLGRLEAALVCVKSLFGLSDLRSELEDQTP